MGVETIGQGGQILQVDTAHRAARASLLPLDVGALGGYRLCMVSGQIAATLAADTVLFALRWTASSPAIINEILVGAIVDGAVTTAVAQIFEAWVGRTFSAAYTGGAAATITGNNNKLRAGFATTALGEARMATTAALGGGTVTLDSQSIGAAIGGTGTTVGVGVNTPMQPVYKPAPGQAYPLTLGASEGIIIKNKLTGPATGSFRLIVAIDWSEVAAFGNAVR